MFSDCGLSLNTLVLGPKTYLGSTVAIFPHNLDVVANWYMVSEGQGGTNPYDKVGITNDKLMDLYDFENEADPARAKEALAYVRYG